MSNQTIQFKISGMHCTSCALNIDLDLEELPGVISSNTNYAKSISKIEFDPDKISVFKIASQISKTGYTVTVL